MNRVLPWILLAVGLVLSAVAVVLGIRGVADAVSSTSTWVGGAPHSVALTQGDWAVYEEVLVRGGTGASVSPSELTVEGPAGAVPVSATTVVGDLTINNRTYVSVARFTAPTDGTYTISGAAEGTSLMLGHPVESTLARAFGYVGLLMLGVLTTLAAVIWLIVAFIVSRSRRPAAAMPAGAPGAVGMAGPPPTVAGPGQWAPDPEDPTQWRWWDGRQWTDQRAPRQ